jgi:hypothetical protein
MSDSKLLRVRQSLYSFLLETPLSVLSSIRGKESLYENFKIAKNLGKTGFSCPPVSPISGGTTAILLPYIVAHKKNFQKSYPDDIRHEK